MTTDELRRIPSFQGLSEEAARALLVGASERAYPSGSVIWRQGTRASSLHVLLAGTARAIRARAGRETVVHRARGGDTLGEIPLFDGGLYPASLVAESPVRMLVLSRSSVMAAMKVDPALAATFLRSLGERVRVLAGRLEDRVADSVRTRLARHLLARAEASSREDFDLGMTQAQLAQDLGTVREVVARRLGELVGTGVLVRRGRARYCIADGPRLEALATSS